jgi:S1-C subfamily serine protease
MRRSWIPAGTGTSLVALTCSLVIAVLAFQFGQAGAADDCSPRRETAVVRAVQHAAPAVVSVFSTARTSRNSFVRGQGSGVIIHPDGYVVTNHHVIDDGATISVQHFNGTKSVPARVVVDAPRNDLALLKIPSNGRLPYVSLSRASILLGETAIAVGNPHGLDDTITVGVVSALGRDAKMSNNVALRNLIQTDASINTGNSGGALLNLDGELIGIIVSLMPRASGIAFAIPSNQVQAILNRGLRSRAPANPLPPLARPPTTARPPALPPRVSTSPPTASRPDGLPNPTVTPSPGDAPIVRKPATTPMRPEDFGFVVRDNGSTLLVSRVTRGGEADKAGLLVGDTLLAVDGSPVEDQTDMLLVFSRSTPGQIYYVEVRREGIHRPVELRVPR